MHNLYVAFMTALALAACSQVASYDVAIVGGGTGGVAAAVQAARGGADVLLLEESPWLGGMLTSAGVSATDGNHRMRSGLFGEFADSLSARYGGMGALATGWVSNMLFEPHVGAAILDNICAGAPSLRVAKRARWQKASQAGNGWRLVYTDAEGRTRRIRARVLIDGTELGDVAAALGVSCEKSPQVQDLTYVAVLKDFGRDATLAEPPGYTPSLYRGNDADPSRVLTYAKLPTRGGPAKYMINWPIEGNDTYADVIEKTPQERKHLLDSAKNITLGFVYYLQTACGFRTLGLADDEFDTPDQLPYYPYYRESRRVNGEVRLHVEDLADPYRNALYRTGIAVGDYPVDHHHHRNPGWKETLAFPPIPSYSVPAGVMIPKGWDNLLVIEKSISVSFRANGTTRLQPVVMQVGQAAGALAALSLKTGSIRTVPVRTLQQAVLDYGGYLMPYLDLPPSDPAFKALQRIGATGILKGTGKPVNWANETWFRAGEPVTEAEVSLEEYFPGKTLSDLGLPLPDGRLTRREMAVAIDSLLHPFERRAVDYSGNLTD